MEELIKKLEELEVYWLEEDGWSGGAWMEGGSYPSTAFSKPDEDSCLYICLEDLKEAIEIYKQQTK